MRFQNKKNWEFVKRREYLLGGLPEDAENRIWSGKVATQVLY